MADQELRGMTVSYEAAPGRLTEVLSYLIARRLERLSELALEQGSEGTSGAKSLSSVNENKTQSN
jgi:hypothetical protein